MFFHRWAKLPSHLTATTKVPVGTHIQGKRRLRNSYFLSESVALPMMSW
jgi:hypothetical protein